MDELAAEVEAVFDSPKAHIGSMFPPDVKIEYHEDFHDLMHRIGTKACWSMGGPRRHIQVWWQYKCEWTPQCLKHRVLCRFGRHHMTGGYTKVIFGRERTIIRRCVWCHKSPEEIAT